jgi:SAM-dependent methyltransferase
MAEIVTSEFLSEIACYYSGKLAEHGATAKGVDWNSEASQLLRFDQLKKVIGSTDGFSVNDFGCGYGALFEYLRRDYKNFFYTGLDVSAAMVAIATQRNLDATNARYVLASKPPEMADYGVASGIFHVRLTRNDSEWRDYFEATVDVMNRTSRRGFSFNCLTQYSDIDKMRSDLYYADPCNIFDRCKRLYSRHVALLHDYGLYEFTILVRKDL